MDEVGRKGMKLEYYVVDDTLTTHNNVLYDILF